MPDERRGQLCEVEAITWLCGFQIRAGQAYVVMLVAVGKALMNEVAKGSESSSAPVVMRYLQLVLAVVNHPQLAISEETCVLGCCLKCIVVHVSNWGGGGQACTCVCGSRAEKCLPPVFLLLVACVFVSPSDNSFLLSVDCISPLCLGFERDVPSWLLWAKQDSSGL
jgi:hypothetical protein